jgi:hypothetical protein
MLHTILCAHGLLASALRLVNNRLYYWPVSLISPVNNFYFAACTNTSYWIDCEYFLFSFLINLSIMFIPFRIYTVFEVSSSYLERGGMIAVSRLKQINKSHIYV